MARSPRVCAALAFLIVAALRCAQGQISRVAGAPFVALRTITTTTNGQTKTETGTVARRSDGSTYFQSGNDRNTLVLISDMRLHRLVSFNSGTHIYSINPDPEMKATTLPVDYQQHVLANLPAEGTKQQIQNGWILTTLGKREIEGVMTVGTTLTNGEGRSSERWHSAALDLDLETISHQPATAMDGETRIQQLRLVEPDGSLFRIPPGYVQDERNKAMVGNIAP